MKKIFNIKNIVLLVIIVLITVLTTSTKEAKAAGTVTWSGPSSITIRETIRNIANPIVAYRDYFLDDENGSIVVGGPTARISYTASDMPTNYQITKSTTMNLSNLTFSKPGDYEYYLDVSDLVDSSDDISLWEYIGITEDCPHYKVTVSVRNVVDANNTPTGNFTATMILEKGTYNEQTEEVEIEKVSPDSGVLYADTYFETVSESFGHIELSKTVKGIGADTTKYFPFTINIDNDDDEGTIIDSSEWVYPISGIDATVTYNGNTITNPTTITDGTPTTIYLKHGQTAIIGQVTSGGNTFDAIPVGACAESEGGSAGDKTCYGSYYTVTENPGNYEPMFFVNRGSNSNSGEQTLYDHSKLPKVRKLLGYDGDPIPGGGEVNPNHFTIPPEEFSGEGYYVRNTGVGTGANIVEFENTKEMSPVTGLIFTILPYLILAAIGVGGTLLIIHLKKEEKKASQ